MRLLGNPTSPFVRVVRLAIEEKGLADRTTFEVVDPWADPPALLSANVAGRVPALIVEDNRAISEAMLILRYLDEVGGPPAYPSEDLAAVLGAFATGYAAMEAAVAVLIGRKTAPDFDAQMVGAKRFRTMTDALARLDADPPRDLADRPDAAGFAAVVAIDYLAFRFPDRDWLSGLTTLAAWRARQAGRRSVETTMPRG